MWASKLLILLITLIDLTYSKLEWKYHSNEELEDYLKNFTTFSNKNITIKYYSIGQSRGKTNLSVVEITATKKKYGVPNVKFVGTIHGNEPVGREMILHFLEFLYENYPKNGTVKWLLENTKISVLPNFNPDGFKIARAYNCYGDYGRKNGPGNGPQVDLNRSFPDFFLINRTLKVIAPEVEAYKTWMSEVPFVLSAALHGGALVVNYPFDSVKKIITGSNMTSLTPDDDTFKHIALVYAKNHLKMGKIACPDNFTDGVTNGAQWYIVRGGMQDYNYAFHGCMDFTIEISCCKYPPAKDLKSFWEENINSLLKFSVEAHRGVTGLILDDYTKKSISNATLKITNRNMTFRSFRTGEFWRLLRPGSYILEVEADGYYSRNVTFTVQSYPAEVFPELTFLNVLMKNVSYSTTSITEKTTELTTDGVLTEENLSEDFLTTPSYNNLTHFRLSGAAFDGQIGTTVREKSGVEEEVVESLSSRVFYAKSNWFFKLSLYIVIIYCLI